MTGSGGFTFFRVLEGDASRTFVRSHDLNGHKLESVKSSIALE